MYKLTGSVIEVPRAQTAAAKGAAILAGIATGVFSSGEDATRSITVGSITVVKQYQPDENRRAVYLHGYERY